MTKTVCLHCGGEARAGRRGLCWRCYYNGQIRELFAPMAKTGRRYCAKFHHKLPELPTSAAPGSPEKVAVLEYRAEEGFQLFHPDDVLTAEE